MTYRVVFRKRFDSEGEGADRPESFVRPPDGVILTAVKAESVEPPALHSQEVLDEDDAFQSLGVETWDYEVHDEREPDFIDALKNSRMVLDYQRIDDITAV